MEKVVKGYTLAYEQDAHYRTAHHSEAVAPTSGAEPVAKAIIIEDPGKAQLFFDRNGLKAYAFEVNHFPAEPAIGYRFEYKGRVVAISGDTKKTDTLARHISHADILRLEKPVHRLKFEKQTTQSSMVQHNHGICVN